MVCHAIVPEGDTVRVNVLGEIVRVCNKDAARIVNDLDATYHRLLDQIGITHDRARKLVRAGRGIYEVIEAIRGWKQG